MKIEKSNNPAAVGALVLVLALIVGKILWMVFGHSGPVAAASTVSAGPPVLTPPPAPVTKAPPAAAPTPASEAERIPLVAAPVTTRNPFSVAIRPALAATRRDSPLRVDGAAHTATVAEAVPLMSLPPLPVRIPESGRGAGAKPSSKPHGLAALPPHSVTAKERTEALPTLKLTATVGGAEPLAVVQTENPQPVVLRVGDALEGMRVVAIYDREVVFARGNGFWTLPLQSAATIAAGSVSMTSVPTASHSVISVAAPED
jgi:hypothetical protein